MKNSVVLLQIVQVFILSLCVGSAWGAGMGGVVRGRVVDVESVGVAYATVAFAADGVQRGVAVTDSLGEFSVRIEQGRYDVKVSHVSYKIFNGEVVVKENDVNMGIFRLEDVSDGIEAVVVSATSVTREADRFVVRVNSVAALSGKDGIELLSSAPGVWADDSGLAINGSKGVKVFVNDRELKLSGDNLVSYLRSLNSADISKVEVIPIAGVEYSADSKGGVIRITLCKNPDNGMMGSVQFSTVQGGGLGSYAPSARIDARVGKWSINSGLSGAFITKNKSFYRESRDYSGVVAVAAQGVTTSAADVATGSDSDGKGFIGESKTDSKKDYALARLGAVYEANKRHSIGGEIEYSFDNNDVPSVAHTVIIRDGVEQRNESRYNQRGNKGYVSAIVNYAFSLDTLGSKLKFIADYTRQKTDANSDYDTSARSNASSLYNIFSSELSFNKIFSNKIKIAAGAKYTRNMMEDNMLFEKLSTIGWEVKRDYSYNLNYTENIAAAYASVSGDIKRWSISAGVRGEYTLVRGKGNKGDGDEVDKSYFKMFPNLSVSYAFNDLRTWMLVVQYARNIERPTFIALNPARIQFSDYSYQVGNPELRPTYIHRASATLVYRYRHTITVGANLHSDLIREVCKLDPADKDIMYIIPENHYMENHYFIAINSPIIFNKWWNITLNFVGVKQDIKLTKESELMVNFLMFSYVISGFTLPAKVYAEVSYQGQSRLYSGNSEVGPRHLLNATVKKKFFDDKLTISLAAQNIMNRGTEYVSHTNGTSRTMHGYSGFSSRYFKLALIYNFRTGKAVKARKIESSSADERLRLKAQEVK